MRNNVKDIVQDNFIKNNEETKKFKNIRYNIKELLLISKKRKNDKEYINKNYPVLQNTNEVEAPMVSQMMSNLKMIKEADEQLSDFNDEESKDSIEINNNNEG